ncbi:hypothetical protein K402DRAFT_403544 [Aulographum hederae CBS 113979]|uniref:GPI-anchored cell wall organization protein Ecm33 n=1 Tax=Aulographum hederae CBS 113979 TaxID=1176131 RepID=A0A6G1H2H1_9PEZI|nr:hypothetical protein K402DRAFT_403544 [Aulographum hederae CBS 113979]
MLSMAKFLLRIFLGALISRPVFAKCSTSATLTITDSDVASSLQSCSTFTGDIAVATYFSGGVSINGLQRIDGNFQAQDVQSMEGLDLRSIERVTGNFTLANLPSLSMLDMMRLDTAGSMTLESLPQLEEALFPSYVAVLSNLTVRNTALREVFTPTSSTMDYLVIQDNHNLTSFTADSNDIAYDLDFTNNHQGIVITLRNLRTAGRCKIQSVSGLVIDVLKSTGNMYFLNNSFSELGAYQLSEVPGDLIISGNTNLNALPLSSLNGVGNLTISANPRLSEVNQMWKLMSASSITLDLQVENSEEGIVNVSFSNLMRVVGDFSLKTNLDVDCSPFDYLASGHFIWGDYSCEPFGGRQLAADLQSNDTSEHPQEQVEQSRNTLSVGAKAGIAVSVSLVGVAILAIGFRFFSTKRKRHQSQEIDSDSEKVAELPTGDENHELPAPHGLSETDPMRPESGIESRYELP